MNLKEVKDYYDGVVASTLEQYQYYNGTISKEKELEWEVEPTEFGYFTLKTKWITGYEPAKFKGDYESPADPDEPVYESKETKISYNKKLMEIILEIEEEFKAIDESPEPELNNNNEIFICDL